MRKRVFLTLATASLVFVLSWAGTARATSCTSDAGSNSPSELLEAIRCLENKIDAFQVGGGDGTFFSAIVAFENYTCPAGWIPYPEGPGRFVIGARQGANAAGPKLGETGVSETSPGPSEQPWVALLYCQRL